MRKLTSILSLLLFAIAVGLVAAPAAMAQDQPPVQDDFPWWCPDWLWPCPVFFGGGGSSNCSQGTCEQKGACRCLNQKTEGDHNCDMLPPQPGVRETCHAGILLVYEDCVEAVPLNCAM